jgi:hypothetical protein
MGAPAPVKVDARESFWYVKLVGGSDVPPVMAPAASVVKSRPNCWTLASRDLPEVGLAAYVSL